MGLKLAADMVALTACQTGLKSNELGGGAMSMGQAFRYAGARSVLMSLWSVGTVLRCEPGGDVLQAPEGGREQAGSPETGQKRVTKDR